MVVSGPTGTTSGNARVHESGDDADGGSGEYQVGQPDALGPWAATQQHDREHQSDDRERAEDVTGEEEDPVHGAQDEHAGVPAEQRAAGLCRRDSERVLPVGELDEPVPEHHREQRQRARVHEDEEHDEVRPFQAVRSLVHTGHGAVDDARRVRQCDEQQREPASQIGREHPLRGRHRSRGPRTRDGWSRDSHDHTSFPWWARETLWPTVKSR